MALYVCNTQNMKIESIIAGHEENISCIAWNSLDDNLIASASVDNQFYIWDISREKAKVHVSLPAYPIMIQWSKLDSSNILFLLSSGSFCVL